MATDHELQIVAAAVAAIREDWPARSVLAHLRRDPRLRDRPYRHLAFAAVAVALDPATKTPARLAEYGPWWKAASVATEDGTPDPPHPMCPDHPQHRSARCPECASVASPPPAGWRDVPPLETSGAWDQAPRAAS